MITKLYEEFGIDSTLIDFEEKVELTIESQFKKIDKIMKYNHWIWL